MTAEAFGAPVVLTIVSLGALSGVGMVAGYVALVPVCAGVNLALWLWRHYRA